MNSAASPSCSVLVSSTRSVFAATRKSSPRINRPGSRGEFLEKRDDVPSGDRRLDNITVAAGPRVHLKLGETLWFRPGIAYARGLDNPMADDDYHIVQVDLPLAF